MRFTGLRAGQTWTGRGREVPISIHLVEYLKGLDPDGDRLFERAWVPEAKWINRCWRAAGIRPAIHGWHAFRRGFETGLFAAGIDLVRVRALIGHSSGVDDSYIDAAGLNLAAAVRAIPPVEDRPNAPAMRARSPVEGRTGDANVRPSASQRDLTRPEAS
jgi:integrase